MIQSVIARCIHKNNTKVYKFTIFTKQNPTGMIYLPTLKWRFQKVYNEMNKNIWYL